MRSEALREQQNARTVVYLLAAQQRPPTRPSTPSSIIAELDQRGARVVISQHPRRAIPLAMRSEKTDSSFSAMMHLATAVIHSR